MSESEDKQIAGNLISFLRILAAIAGATAGAALLLFFAGFLAQRAQFDLAGLPFVFVDYWSNVEVGTTGAIRSVVLLLGSYEFLVFILALTVALVLLLESSRFRRIVARPHWLLLASVLLLMLVGLLLRQQLAVSQMGKVAERESRKQSVETNRDKNALPVKFPFDGQATSGFIAPTNLFSNFKDHSAEDLWLAIADELEADMALERPYLQLRPIPIWMLPGRGAQKNGTVIRVFGSADSESRSDLVRTPSELAEDLFAQTLRTALFCCWSLVVLWAWKRELRNRYLDETDPESDQTPTAKLLNRLKEEMWWIASRVILPTNAALLIFSMLVLAPESYGRLAMKKIGEDKVEVVIEQKVQPAAEKQAGPAQSKPQEKAAVTNDGSAGKSPEPKTEMPDLAALLAKLSGSSADKLTSRDKHLELSSLAVDYFSAEPEEKGRLKEKWEAEIAKIEALNSPLAWKFLVGLTEMAASYVPDLAEISRKAEQRLRAELAPTLSGFILFHPRSKDESHLRLFSPSDSGFSSRGEFVPIRLDQIKEIRLVGDNRTARLVQWLRELPGTTDEDQRKRILADMELHGHRYLLEAFLAATQDTDREVAGANISSVARYARNLPDDAYSRARRLRAVKVLQNYMMNPDKPVENRGAAATSLYLAASPEHGAMVGSALIKVLTDADYRKSDPGWVVAGTAVTALGKIRHKAAVPHLVSLVTNATAPLHVRKSVPTAVHNIDDKLNSIPPFSLIVLDPNSPPEILGTAVTALGLLGKGATAQQREQTIGALTNLYDRLMAHVASKQPLVPESIVSAVMTALIKPQDYRVVPLLQQVVKDRRMLEVPDVKRAFNVAMLGLRQMPEASSEPILLGVAKDSSLAKETRQVAIVTLAEFHGSETVRELRNLALRERTATPIVAAILAALEKRAQSGEREATFSLETLRRILGIEAD